MNYVTAFDIGRDGFAYWWLPIPLAIALLVGLAHLYLSRVKLYRPAPPLGRRISAFGAFLAFFIFLNITAFLLLLTQYAFARWTLNDGSALFVEGPVANFHPMPAAGHDDESFTVQGIHFRYSDYVISPGFHHTSSHGGPICPDLPVRIWYDTDGNILKLQIAPSAIL